MSEHLDLLGLLRGVSLGNTDTIAAGDHLATCAGLPGGAGGPVVGHALLTRASRTAGTGRGPPAAPRARPPCRRPARRRRGTLLAVAAAVVVAVGVTGALWWRSDEPGRRRAPAMRGHARSPFGGSPATAASAWSSTTAGPRCAWRCTTCRRPRAGSSTTPGCSTPSTNKMLALGLVDPDSGATFDIDDALVASYSAVDVSLEADDGDPAHSVTSVLRGTYEPDQIATAQPTPRGNHPMKKSPRHPPRRPTAGLVAAGVGLAAPARGRPPPRQGRHQEPGRGPRQGRHQGSTATGRTSTSSRRPSCRGQGQAAEPGRAAHRRLGTAHRLPAHRQRLPRSLVGDLTGKRPGTEKRRSTSCSSSPAWTRSRRCCSTTSSPVRR